MVPEGPRRPGSERRWTALAGVLVLLAGVGLAVPAAVEAGHAGQRADAGAAVADLARLGGSAGALVSFLQDERGQALMYLGGTGTPLTLAPARAATDAAARVWQVDAGSDSGRLVVGVRGQLAGLAAERVAVSARQGSAADHAAWYGRLATMLAGIAADATGRVERAGVPAARLYVSLLVVTEQLGQEREEIAGLLLAGTTGTRAGALDVVARRAVRVQQLQIFSMLSTPAEVRALAAIGTRAPARFVAGVEQSIVDQDAARLAALDPAVWFTQASTLLDEYGQVLADHQAVAQAGADRSAVLARHRARRALAVAAGSLTIGLALGAGLLVAARRRIRAGARRALRQAEDDAARIDAILATAADAILSVNQQGLIDRANPATETLFGYRPDELVGQSAFRLVPPVAGAGFEGRLEEYYAQAGEEFVGRAREGVGLRRDGSQFPVEVLTTRRSIGGRVQFTAIVRDITERRAVLDELTRRDLELSDRNVALARSNAELQQFAYVASHDLQEPLRKVTSYVEVLEADYGDRLDEQAREYMRLASTAAQRMRQLINDLLALSRIREEGMRVGECDLRAVVAGIIDDFEVVLRDAGAEVEVGDLPTVPGDAAHLQQLFQNLLSNAVKYRSGQPLRVEIGARTEPGGWHFTVRDNGVGFPQEYAGTIFGMFKRLVSRREYEGTGIGLAIVAKIVANHGGRIWATSEPGVGTSIDFVLPAVVLRIPAAPAVLAVLAAPAAPAVPAVPGPRAAVADEPVGAP